MLPHIVGQLRRRSANDNLNTIVKRSNITAFRLTTEILRFVNKNYYFLYSAETSCPFPADTIYSTKVGSMLDQRRRLWADIGRMSRVC